VASVDEVTYGFEMPRCAAAQIQANPGNLVRHWDTKCVFFVDFRRSEECLEGADGNAGSLMNLLID
jgi:hypothetical protein